jgi:hypothetical protein
VVERNAANGGADRPPSRQRFRAGFAESSDAAAGLEHGFRVFASKKLRPHIDDVMRTNKNVVFLWTVTPPQEEINAVFDCLKG